MESNLRQLWQVNKYLWMSLAFALLYLPVAHAQNMFTVPIRYAWLLFVVAVANVGFRTYLGIRQGGHVSNAWGWFLTYLDILLISLAVAISGGIASDLWMLYFVVMIFESFNAAPITKRLMDVNIAVAYLLASLPYQLSSVPPPMPAAAYIRVLASRLFFIILVSALARRISANAAARNQENLLLREQMAATEERARIAREIHDGLGHALVSSILRLELCSRLIAKKPDEVAEILKEEIPALRAAWNQGRDLAFHLRPWEMEAVGEDGLIDTLRRHIGRFAERTGLVVALKADESLTLRPEAAFGLTRIVQEALTNAAKHAQATSIEVALTPEPKGGARCIIRDNGKGFDTEKAVTGIGLLAMRERAEALGGTFEIASAPDDGVTLTITLPS